MSTVTDRGQSYPDLTTGRTRYKREEGSTRNYKLLPRSKRWLTVQAIIRIDGLRFEGGRDPRSGSQVFSVVSRELSEACLS